MTIDLSKYQHQGAILIPEARLSYPELFTPTYDEDQETGVKRGPFYRAALVFPKGSITDKILHAALEQYAKDKWPQNYKDKLEVLADKKRIPIKDGDLRYKDKGEKEAYLQGHNYVNAKSKIAPTLYTLDRATIKTEQQAVDAQGQRILYAGCNVQAFIDLYYYPAVSGKYSEGFGIGLRAVRFVSHNDAFAGSSGVSAESFPEIEGETAEKDSSGFSDDVDPLA